MFGSRATLGILASALVLTGCGDTSEPPGDAGRIDVELVADLSDDDAAAVGDAVNAFGFDLLDEVADGSENVVTSPVSVATLLAMVLAGAGGDTADEMADVLHLDDSRDVRVGALLRTVADTDDVTLSVGNGSRWRCDRNSSSKRKMSVSRVAAAASDIRVTRNRSQPMRIVHISDLHIEPEPERRFPGLMASLESDRTQLMRTGADLLLVTGDVTNYGARYRDHLVLAQEWIDSIGIPALTVPGNHDLGPSLARAAESPESEPYQDVPYPETNYGVVFHSSPVVSHDLGAIRVVGIGLREGDADGALAQLDRLLAAEERPVILCGHYPVADTRDLEVSREFGSAPYLPTTAPALREVVHARRNVAVYACGHVHLNSARQVASHCVQITAGGLGPGASTYRVYEIDDRGLTYSTVLGSGPLTFWEGVSEAAAANATFSLGGVADRTGRITWPQAVSRGDGDRSASWSGRGPES